MKKAKVSVLLLLPLLTLTSCSKKPYVATSVPENTDLVLFITQEFRKSEEENLVLLSPGFGIADYIEPKYDLEKAKEDPSYPRVVYTVSGYPDVEDSGHVTSILITDQNVRAFGLTLNSPITQLNEKRKELGYKGDYSTRESQKRYTISDGVTFTFTQGEKRSFFAKTTNKGNIQF